MVSRRLLVMWGQRRWREIVLYLPWGRKREPRTQWSTEPASRSALTRCLCSRRSVHWQGTTGNGFGSTFQTRAAWFGWLLPAAEPAGVLFSKNTGWRAVFIAPGSVRAAEDESSFPAASVSEWVSGGLALVLLSLTPSPSQPFSQCRAGIPQQGENPVEFQMSCS